MERLIDYTETSIPRGTIFKCKGVYPYEEVVYFLLCELGDSYGLMVISGYKAGLAYVCFPKESIPEGYKFGLRADWLKENWQKWGYIDCQLKDVYICENTEIFSLL